MKPPKLEDLTKPELLALIRSRLSAIRQGDINRVRWDDMTGRASRMMDEASADMDRFSPSKSMDNYLEWKAACDRFEKAETLYQKADRFFNEVLMAKEKGRAATRPKQPRWKTHNPPKGG